MNFTKIVILCLMLQGCSDITELSHGKPGESFSYSDPRIQEKVLKIMSENDIKYEIGDYGEVNYLLKNQAEVHGIKREIEHGKFLNENYWEATTLYSDVQRQKYESAFNKNGIPYRISEHNGILHIRWSQKYGPRVDVIRQEVESEVMDIFIGKNRN